VEANVRRCDVGLAVLRPEARAQGELGLETVTGMVERRARSGSVLAAVNADFFTPEGATLGAEVVDGKVTAARERPTLAWRPGSAPWIGRTEISGDTLRLGWDVVLDGSDSVTEAVSGFPELLRNARPTDDFDENERGSFGGTRHPRTAVGYDPRAGRLWLAVVDGRDRGLEPGRGIVVGDGGAGECGEPSVGSGGGAARGECSRGGADAVALYSLGVAARVDSAFGRPGSTAPQLPQRTRRPISNVLPGAGSK